MSKGRGRSSPQTTTQQVQFDPAAVARINQAQDTVQNWAMPIIISGAQPISAGADPLQDQARQLAQSMAANPAALTPAALGADVAARFTTGSPFGALPQMGALTAGAGPTIAAPAAVQASQMDVNRYLNPYMKDVVDTSLADFDTGADRSRNAMNMRQAATGAFGGSRHGVASGVFEADAARGRGSLAGNLRSQGYAQAAQMADSQANRDQQAALQNAQMQNAAVMAQAQLDADRVRQQDAFNQFTAQSNFGLARDAAMATPGLQMQAAGQMGQAALNAAQFNQDVAQQNYQNLMNTGGTFRDIKNQQNQDQLQGIDALLRSAAMTPMPATTTTTQTPARSGGKGGFLGELGMLAARRVLPG